MCTAIALGDKDFIHHYNAGVKAVHHDITLHEMLTFEESFDLCYWSFAGLYKCVVSTAIVTRSRVTELSRMTKVMTFL
jgi:hypothetical protein